MDSPCIHWQSPAYICTVHVQLVKYTYDFTFNVFLYCTLGMPISLSQGIRSILSALDLAVYCIPSGSQANVDQGRTKWPTRNNYENVLLIEYYSLSLTFGSCLALFMILRHVRSIVWNLFPSIGNCLLMSSDENIGSRYSQDLWQNPHSSSTSCWKKR